MSRWDRYRTRRPNRSPVVETAVITTLVALVVISFGAVLYAVISKRAHIAPLEVDQRTAAAVPQQVALPEVPMPPPGGEDAKFGQRAQ